MVQDNQDDDVPHLGLAKFLRDHPDMIDEAANLFPPIRMTVPLQPEIALVIAHLANTAKRSKSAVMSSLLSNAVWEAWKSGQTEFPELIAEVQIKPSSADAA